jgi:hypothetical protein
MSHFNTDLHELLYCLDAFPYGRRYLNSINPNKIKLGMTNKLNAYKFKYYRDDLDYSIKLKEVRALQFPHGRKSEYDYYCMFKNCGDYVVVSNLTEYQNKVNNVKALKNINYSKIISPWIYRNEEFSYFIVFNSKQTRNNFFKVWEREFPNNFCFHETIMEFEFQKLRFDFEFMESEAKINNLDNNIIENMDDNILKLKENLKESFRKIMLNSCLNSVKMQFKEKNNKILIGKYEKKAKKIITRQLEEIKLCENYPELLKTFTINTINERYNYIINPTKEEINRLKNESQTLKEIENNVSNSLKNVTIIITKSSGKKINNNGQEDYKHSYHIIFDGFYVKNCHEAKKFYELTVEQLLKTTSSPLVEYLDPQVYNKTQNFRYYGCSKVNENRKKILTDKFNDNHLQKLIKEKSNSVFNLKDISITDLDVSNMLSIEEYVQIYRLDNYSNGKETNTYSDDVIQIELEKIGYFYKYSHDWNDAKIYKVYKNFKCNECEKIHTDRHAVVWEKNYNIYIKCNGGSKTLNLTKKKLLETNKIDNLQSYIDHIITKYRKKETYDIDEIIEDEPTVKDYKTILKDGKNVLFVNVSTAMGKTKTSRKYINEEFKDNLVGSNIIFVSYRRYLCNHLQKDFPDFSDYRSCKSPSGIRTGRWIITPESLGKIHYSYKPDLIIFDESERGIDSLFKKLINGPTILSTFQRLLKESKKIICMDANMSNYTINFIKNFRITEECILYTNTFKKHSNETAKITFNQEEATKLFLTDISNSKKPVIVSNSKRKLEAFDVLIKEKFNIDKKITNDNKVVILITSETSENDRKLYFDILDNQSERIVAFLYSPTIEAGVSIEIELFDKCYGFFNNKSCNFKACHQMLNRVRQLKSNEYIIALNTTVTEKKKPDSIETIKKKIYAEQEWLNEFQEEFTNDIKEFRNFDIVNCYAPNSWFVQLYLQYLQLLQKNKYDFMFHFIKCLWKSGIKILSLTQNISKEEKIIIKKQIKDICIDLKKEELNEIIAADLIDINKKNELNIKKNDGLLTKLEYTQLQLYNFVDFYKLAMKPPPDTIRKFSDRNAMKCFKNITVFYNYDINTNQKIKIPFYQAFENIKTFNKEKYFNFIKKQNNDLERSYQIIFSQNVVKHQLLICVLNNLGFTYFQQTVTREYLDSNLERTKQFIYDQAENFSIHFCFNLGDKEKIKNYDIKTLQIFLRNKLGSFYNCSIKKITKGHHGSKVDNYSLNFNINYEEVVYAYHSNKIKEQLAKKFNYDNTFNFDEKLLVQLCNENNCLYEEIEKIMGDALFSDRN